MDTDSLICYIRGKGETTFAEHTPYLRWSEDLLNQDDIGWYHLMEGKI